MVNKKYIQYYKHSKNNKNVEIYLVKYLVLKYFDQ